jgi:signal transduction histidine kinase
MNEPAANRGDVAVLTANSGNAFTSLKLNSSFLFGLGLALYAVSYYLAARLGLGFRFQNSQIGIIWPANALLVAALVLTGMRRWWLVLIATALAHTAALGTVVPVWRLLWQIAGNTIFATVMAEMLRRTAGSPLHFGNRRQVITYVSISFLAPMLFTLVAPAFVLSLLHREPYAGPAAALLRTTLSNATALLLVTPVVLLWAMYGIRRVTELPRQRLCEAAAIIISLLAVGLFAFGGGPRIVLDPSLLLWFFPPLLWAAVRFGPIGASTSLFAVAAISIWGTARHLGPFVFTTHSDKVLSLQLFWIVLWVPVMLLASVIREREEAEAALQEQRNALAHATRVTTVGTLSGALAHELGQPLGAILANAHAAINLLASHPEDLRELQSILVDITQQDKQAVSIIERLRLLLKEGKSRFETLGLEIVVRDALALARGTVEMAGVIVQTQVEAGLPRVRGDTVQLIQVMLNLIVNACDSMIGVPHSDRLLSVRIVRILPDRVEVQIADSGLGLPGGREDRVFEPFFTTKEKGLGLGLAICRSIAMAHHGQLWCANNTGRGATFHLVLPVDTGEGSCKAA